MKIEGSHSLTRRGSTAPPEPASQFRPEGAEGREERKMAEQHWRQKEAELTFCRKAVLCTEAVEEAVHQRRQLGLQILNPASQGLAPASDTDQLPLQGLEDTCSVPETDPPTAPTSQGWGSNRDAFI